MTKKKYLRLAIAQINTCVGDFQGNLQKIISYIDQAKAKGCDIVSFPELAVCGYPPEDLLFKKGFLKENTRTIKLIKERTENIVAIVGFVDSIDWRLFNSAAVLANKIIVDVYHKMHLPNYGVFDEKRYFLSGEGRFSLYEIYGRRFCINICEDAWVPDGTIQAQAKSGAGLILTINASPYHMGKCELRRKILSQRSRENKVCISYANLIGGQDELVFDGQSMFISAEGKVLSVAAAFGEELCILDLDLGKIPRKTLAKNIKVFSIDIRKTPPKGIFDFRKTLKLRQEEEVFRALVTGTRDYVQKNGFSKAVLGLSGGIDSSLVAVIAKEALGKENVLGIIMPSRFNSQDSYDDAAALSKGLGIDLKVIPIQDIFEGYLKTLSLNFLNLPWNVAEENLQARIRGNILMALSNKFGWLVLTTGNKSEMSVGYATLYGDMAGGFAVIKDVPKTYVYRLAEFYNQRAGSEIIPQRVFLKAPTAELKENQKDTDSLPAYRKLDSILKYYVEEDLALPEIVKKGFARDIVLKVIDMVDRSEYKRRQTPPGIKITPRAFGRDRRMPITNRFKEIVGSPPVKGI